MPKFIPLSVPNLKGNELEYVSEAIRTEWVSTGGPYVTLFEKNIAAYVGVQSAVSCQNGTAGLHIALLLAGVGYGDEVLVPTLTFIAAVNPVTYVGAKPVFMDCDASLTMDMGKLRRFCTEECIFENGFLTNKLSRKRIKAVIVVHVFGNLADMEELMDIAHAFGLKVIEDATEALGTYFTQGRFANRHAGTIGDVGVYSFNGNKIMTTGGGGMIVSNDTALLKHAKHLTTQAKSDEVNFIHDEIGFNYRMTNLQAALGIAQLETLESFIETKTKNYNFYKNAIDTIEGLHMLAFRSDIRCNHWFYSVYVEDGFNLSRDALIRFLDTRNIQTRPIWGLIHEQIPYRGAQTYDITCAHDYWAHVVNIPCSTNLTSDDALFVVEALKLASHEAR
jgi:perosamine synthetase